MLRRACLTTFLLALLLNSVTVARAGPSNDERPTADDAPFVLSRGIEDHVLQLSRRDRARVRLPWDATKGVGASQMQLNKCESKKNGMIIGAVVGAVAGAVVGVLIVRGVSGAVLGASNGGPRYIAYWTMGGAGVGALSGLAWCS